MGGELRACGAIYVCSFAFFAPPQITVCLLRRRFFLSSHMQRMHKGVLRDIEREEAEKAAACDNGVCDLAQTRFRDPVTGQVKEARAAGSQPPQTLPER